MSYPGKPDDPKGLRSSNTTPVRRDAQFRPIAERPQKRSLAVPLLALGGAAIVGLSMLGRGQDVQRNRYDSLEDCVHDYTTGQCEIDNAVGSNGAGGLHYYGPWYRGDGRGGATDPGPGRTLGTTARSFPMGGFAEGPRSVELGTRGGFGSSGRVSARGS
ncbi:hypothetical protein [Dyella sp. 20L07]|uniref:hypothetical protein n=1 Tax=Dyella sp. 20L07 TaxID=3384240 RepID=UPI003D276FC5